MKLVCEGHFFIIVLASVTEDQIELGCIAMPWMN